MKINTFLFNMKSDTIKYHTDRRVDFGPKNDFNI